MIITDATKIAKPFREYRKGLTLAAHIRRRLDYYQRYHSDKLSPAHEHSAQAAIANLETFTTRLVSEELISHTIERHPGRDLIRRATKDVMWDIFRALPQPRPAQLSSVEQAVVDLMTESGRQKRGSMQEAALTYEIAYRARHDWFMVFNTLTVDDRYMWRVFNPASKAFKDYIRKVDRLSAVASYGTVRNAKDQEHHSYFAVVEEGGKTGRLHIHVLHFLKTLPKKCRDPNRALAVPTRRELEALKPLWPFGHSAPIMVRFSPLDAFGKAGYRWPYDTRTEKALKVKSPLALANYMSKYITKGYASPKRSKYLWRIRKSQKLGRQIIAELVSPLTPPQLLSLAANPVLSLKLNNQLIPSQLLREAALRRYNFLCMTSPLPSILELAKHIQPLPSPLRSLRASAPAGGMCNRQNTTSTGTPVTNETGISESALEALRQSGKAIRSEYFRTNSATPKGTTTTRDYIHPTVGAASQTRAA